MRYDEHREVNKKTVRRLWREEGLQAWVHSPRKRSGVSTIPPGGGGCAEGGVGARFPVRLHHRRQGDQDRVDDRRPHPLVVAARGGALDHRRAAGVRGGEGLHRGRRAAEGGGPNNGDSPPLRRREETRQPEAGTRTRSAHPPGQTNADHQATQHRSGPPTAQNSVSLSASERFVPDCQYGPPTMCCGGVVGCYSWALAISVSTARA